MMFCRSRRILCQQGKVQIPCHQSTYFRGAKKISGKKAPKSPGADTSVLHHFLKTAITYAVPVLLFGGISLYSSKTDEKKDKDSESPGNLFRRILKGERVWDELGPRKEYIKVTRLNDKFNNYKYCLEKPSSGKVAAEEHIKHSEVLSKLRNTGLLDRVQEKLRKCEISTEHLQQLRKAEEKYCASIFVAQAEADKALRLFRSHSLDIVATESAQDKAYRREVLRGDVEREGARFARALEKQLAAEQLYLAELSCVLSEDERSSLKQYLTSAGAPGMAASHLYKEPPVSFAMLSGVAVGAGADEVAVAGSGEVPRVYVLHFDGDVVASQVHRLREEVTAILQQSDPARGDSAVLRLNSSGGTVTGYGLAASQLERLRQAKLPLTVCVDEVAASGGYMMACVADTICASPFSAVGSIGVVATNPNVYERLKREGMSVTDITAGEHKRTLAPYKAVEPQDAQKVQEDVTAIFQSFQEFILQHRPGLRDSIAQVATGEVWYGREALKRGLVDEIRTVDDVLLDCLKANNRAEILQLRYVGDRIEAKEDREQFDRWVAAEGSDGSPGGGIIDRGLKWMSRRLVVHMMAALGVDTNDSVGSGAAVIRGQGAVGTTWGGNGEVVANSGSVGATWGGNGEIVANSGLRSHAPMVRDARFER